MKLAHAYLFVFLIPFILFSQSLPIQNGEFEQTTGTEFSFWSNQSNNNADAIFDVVTNNELIGSTKALRIQVNSLGAYQHSVQTKTNHTFSVDANQKISISFFAKATSTTEDPTISLCISDSSIGSSVFKQASFVLTQNWEQYTHTFTVNQNVGAYQLSFIFLNANSIYFLDNVNVMPGNSIAFNLNERFQTVEGFGGGIKRRTELLNALPASLRNTVEDLVYKDLKINMLRFFIHHTIENNQNDNNNPSLIDLSNTSWNYYSVEVYQVGATIQRAISKSDVGIDHLIGNCNSAPGWMKKNESHKRASEDQDVTQNTLKSGMEHEFSEFIEIFLLGLKQNFDIDVTEVSITNEPDFLNTYESMNLTPAELINIIPVLRNRLDGSSFSAVNIISPETSRVSPSERINNKLTTVNSSLSYINEMFLDAETKEAISAIATHTYYDSSHNADWNSLVYAADGKPVWVTESAVLKSLDFSMNDASSYIKWITRGFNEGGMTAYMAHLLFDKHIYESQAVEVGKSGSSGLVVWDDSQNVILPKRYFAFKHFSVLSGKGFTRVLNSSSNNDLFVSSFINSNQNQLVVHVFNPHENLSTLSMEIPHDSDVINRYTTNDVDDLNFTQTSIEFENNSRYFETELTPNSLNSFVFDFTSALDTKLLNSSTLFIYPNPTKGRLYFSNLDGIIKCSVYNLNGQKVKEELIEKGESMDLTGLFKGLYFISTESKNGIQNFKLILN